MADRTPGRRPSSTPATSDRTTRTGAQVEDTPTSVKVTVVRETQEKKRG